MAENSLTRTELVDALAVLRDDILGAVRGEIATVRDEIATVRGEIDTVRGTAAHRVHGDAQHGRERDRGEQPTFQNRSRQDLEAAILRIPRV